MSSVLDLREGIKRKQQKLRPTRLKMSFKNSLAIFPLLPGKFTDLEVNSKYCLFVFYKCQFVFENYIFFAQKAEIHVHKNGELECNHS